MVSDKMDISPIEALTFLWDNLYRGDADEVLLAKYKLACEVILKALKEENKCEY